PLTPICEMEFEFAPANHADNADTKSHRKRGEGGSCAPPRDAEFNFEVECWILGVFYPNCSRAAHVGAGAGVDFDGFALFNEERNVDCLPGLEQSRFGHIARSVAPQPFG